MSFSSFQPSSAPLTEDEIEFLNQTLQKHGTDESVLDMSELDGYLTAIVSGPNVIPMSQWFPSLWGDEGDAPILEADESQRFIGLLTQHMNQIVGMLMEQPAGLQAIFNMRAVDGKEYLIVDEWCEGYIRGVALDKDNWLLADQELIDDELGVIALFAGLSDSDLNALDHASAEILQKRVEPAALELHAYWLAQRASFQPTVPTVLRTQKTGRNTPCPCGSGKKYKQCCMR